MSQHEFSIKLPPFSANKGWRPQGVAAVLAMSSAQIGEDICVTAGRCRRVEPRRFVGVIQIVIDVVELPVEKGASAVLMPVSARQELFDLTDDMPMKVKKLVYCGLGVSTESERKLGVGKSGRAVRNDPTT